MELFSLFIIYLLLLITILVSVAFVTLMEQKILGGVQIRLGPNKVGYWGILQPFADAVKLFVKETSLPRMSNGFYFLISPIISLILSLMVWLVLPFNKGGLIFNLSILYFICVSGMSVFPILAAGWSSNSKYSLLGGLRAVCQMISYEVSLALVLLSLCWLMNSLSFNHMLSNQKYFWNIVILLPLGMIWFVSSLAETNRTPYDFSEGESELVSGFNTEYSAGGFTLIFMSEYASIIFMSFLFVVMFLSSSMNMMIMIKSFIVVFFFVWVRGTMPRFRYDKLMLLAWKKFLPLSLFFLCYYMCLL